MCLANEIAAHWHMKIVIWLILVHLKHVKNQRYINDI
jgi:hypothetical protein